MELWTTSSDEARVVGELERQPEVSFGTDSNHNVPATNVDEIRMCQRMEGRGAAFRDGAAWLVNQKLSATPRDEVIKLLASGS